MPGFVVLANQSAGSVQERALGDVVAVLAGIAPTVLHRTANRHALDRVLDDLDGRRLVVAGGDGTLHRVVNGLRARGRADVPIGLVPLGTGNDLARGVGLPLEPRAAAERVGRGTPHRLPVALHGDSGEAILNNAHAGIGERAARRAGGLKSRLGALAYPTGAVLAGIRAEASSVVVRANDDAPYEGTALAVVVALGPSAGGGHRVAPEAEPAEPVLDVVLVEAESLRGRLAVGWNVLVGRDPADRPDVERWTGRTVEISHVGRDEVHWDVDGEARTWPSPVRLSIEPSGWSLVH